jgi:hypothetical protein
LLATLVLTAALAVQVPAEGPRADFATALEARFRSDRFFKELAWVREDACAPLVLYVQKHPLDRPNYAASLVDFYGVWLAELARVFQEQLAAPAGLARDEDHAADAVFLLLSEGDYLNYRKLVPSADPYFGHYDRRLGLTVGYEDMGGYGAPHHRRNRILRPFVEGLLAAHYAGDSVLPPSWFVREGINTHLITHIGREPSALQRRQIEPRWLEDLHRALLDPAARGVYLSAPDELLAATTSTQVWTAVWRRANERDAKARRTPYGETTVVLPTVWIYYLTQTGDDERRAAFHAFFGATMKGAPALAAFGAAFPDRIELERGFWRWVQTENRRVHGEALPLDETAIEKLLSLRAEGAVDLAALAAEMGGEDGGGALVADPEELRPDAKDALVRHALALQDALAGDVEGALADIEALLIEESDGPSGGRLQREAARLAGLARVRSGYLADVAARGGKLKLTRGERKQSFTVARIEDGVVHFDGGRQLESIPVSSIPPHDVAIDMSKYLAGSEDAWFRYYVYVLAEDERWRRLLKGGTQERTDLRDDANEWYPGLLRLGRVARTLEGLADAGVPEDQVAAGHVIDTVEALVAEHGSLQIVAARREALRALTAESLAHFYDDDALSQGLGGRLQRLDGLNVRLTYEFDSEAEAADFRPDPGYFAARRKRVASITTPDDEAGYRVVDGALKGKGSVCYRLPVRFAAPITLQAEVEYGRIPSGGAPETFLWFAICADAKTEDAYVLSDTFGNLVVTDIVNRFNRQAFTDTIEIDSGRKYECRLVHTGDDLATYLDGAMVKTLEAGPIKKGGVLVSAHSDTPIMIHRLEIRGALSEAEFARLQREWIAAELGRLGL